jgi:tRNA(His) 5'-end guanylyltransferase
MGKFDKDSLGNRQKEYEVVYKQQLVPKMPIVLRCDGNAFHTFCKGLKKPFDDIIATTMQQTMVALCKELPTCKLGYTQSDEITLVCIIDDITKTEGLYKYRAQKIISLVAAKATKYFNKFFFENVEKLENNPDAFKNIVSLKTYKKKLFEATFDCRVMNIPDWDIINNLIWRQQDATRNSIQMLGQANYSQKEINKKTCSEIMDMLMLEKNINWNNLEVYKKRGCCCYKVETEGKKRPEWYLDLNMPILTEPKARQNFIKIMFKNVKNNPLLINFDDKAE